MSEPWDAVVVGAGPAGAASAIRLARRGLRVLLLDREHFPRPKPCGECLSPGAVAELEALGVLREVLSHPHERLDGWRISAPSGRWFDGSFPGTRWGVAIQRSTLDALLVKEARRAGATVLTGVRATDLHPEEQPRVVVREGDEEGEVTGRLVIGADGLRSIVLRRLQLLRRGPRLRKVALTAHVRGVDPLPGRGELHLVEGGCIGFAAVGDGIANVTLVLPTGRSEELRGDASLFFDREVRGHPRFATARRVDEVLATGPFDWPVRRAVEGTVALVGDAAGYFDPFTGQGVYRALRGAALLDASAGPALARGEPLRPALARYESARRRAFQPGERLQRVIEAVVARPRAMEVATRVLHARPRAAAAIVAVTGDVAPARSLLSPGLLLERGAR